MRVVIRFFLSLRTAIVFFTAFMAIAVAGSSSLVKNLAFFSGIDDTPLFQWLMESDAFRAAWWIYAMIFVISLLAVNTVFCTADALLKKAGLKKLLLKLSPEIIHIGVLLIMLGHLLTASMGFKADMVINKGESRAVAGSAAIIVNDVRLKTDAEGYAQDWEADLQWSDAGGQSVPQILRPVHPLYFGQFGVYIKAVTLEPEPSVQVRVCRDLGAPWALAGGIVLSLGCVTLLMLRLRRGNG